MAKTKIITKRMSGIPRKWQRVQSTLDKKRERTLAVEKAGRETPRVRDRRSPHEAASVRQYEHENKMLTKASKRHPASTAYLPALATSRQEMNFGGVYGSIRHGYRPHQGARECARRVRQATA